MKSEIKIRQKRVLVWILIAALLWNHVTPAVVQASMTSDGSDIYENQILFPDDTISCTEAYGMEVQYCDADEYSTVLYTAGKIEMDGTHTVLSYEDVVQNYTVSGEESGTTSYEAALTTSSFYGWKVKSIYQSGGEVSSVQLVAVPKRTITYKLNDGYFTTTDYPTEYVEGVGVELVDASKDGHNFLGWYSDADCTNEVKSISTDITGDITLYAKWEVASYTITYMDSDGVTNLNLSGDTTPNTYTYGTAVSITGKVEKEGYTFDGWYSAATDGIKIESITDTQYGDVTLYARYIPNVYNITYELDGGTNADSNPGSYTYGTGVGNFVAASKTGHTFIGWYDAATDGNKITSISGTQTGNITLYAQYTVDSYTIAYKDSDGTDLKLSGDGTPSTYTYGTAVSITGIVEKEGYTFTGWYNAATGGEKIETISASQTGNITLYAQYTANTYTITYVLDGGTNASENPNGYTYGKGVASFGNATKPGYTFDGWYSDATFENQVTSIGEAETGTVSLYAKFTANKYKINYELNGGTNSESNPAEYTYGVGVLDFAEASKDGYTFDGWYSDATFTTKVESIDTTEMQDVTLYAKFTANIYKITYELNGGINVSANPAEYTYGVGVSSFAAPTKEGYTFGGWYRDAAFTNPISAIGTTETGAVTLYAKWIANSYGITYVLDGGSNGENNPTRYTVGVGVASFADASKEGYTFNGWYNATEGGTQITSISDTQIGEITLYAQYTANTYNITYELDGGTNASSNPVEYTYGVGVFSFADASKTGYTFDGWYLDVAFENPVTAIGTTETGAVTLYAKFTVNTYVITYELNGGTNASDNPDTYTYEKGIASLADASKTGYTFAGWYTDAEYSIQVESISATQTGDIKLYAKWTVNTYNISYKNSDGTDIEVNVVMNPSTYTYGVGLSSLGTVAKEGYTFAGWYSDPDGGTKVESISATQTEDVVLYARFTVNSYTITYELDGGTNGVGNPSTYTYGVGVSSFAEASKEGHTFAGWYLDEAFTSPVTSIGTTETGEVNLYAKFTVNSYGITYELNGGTNGAGNPSAYTYGTGVSSFANASKEGHTFKGWYDAATGGTKVESISGTQTGDITLYAQYDVNTYSITYVLNGGTNASENPNGYTYGKGVASFGNATKPGYTFDGWYSDATFENQVTSIGEAETGTVSLYAKFTANKYKINYELNGGTNSESNPAEYTYGVGVLDFAEASKDGYTFDGWYSDATFTTKVESIDTTEMQDVTLYAKFTANIYKITYELNGGINVSANPAEYTYGVGVSSFAAPTKEGYTFGGWYRDAAFTNPISAIGTTETGAVTLYAKWIANSYGITYVLDGGSNGENNPTRYTVGVGVASFADASKEGYTFNGWYNATEGGTQITSISDTQIGEITLYAQYTANTYNITYELDGGTNASSNPVEYTYGVGVSSLADASLEGHTFGGWYTDEGLTTSFSSISTTTLGNITLYAKWIVNSYNISYKNSDGTDVEVDETTNPSTYTFGEGVSKLGTATKEGYIFNGWYTDADFRIKEESISESQTGDITLYAKWTEIVIEPEEEEPETDVPIEEPPTPETDVPTEEPPTVEPDVPTEETVVIEGSGTVSLKAGTTYVLGSGTWKIVGDDTIYMGDMIFYVAKDMECEFVKQ